MILDIRHGRPVIIQLQLNFEPTDNPCRACSYNGICDSDECANKLYPLDVPTTRFKNLGEYIKFIKQQNWL